MYLGIDIGASKTLLAVFSEDGKLIDKVKVETSEKYSTFLNDLKIIIEKEFGKYNFRACCCALPGRIDRKNGIGLHMGNLAWQNIPIKKDLELLLGCPRVYIENDAKLAGLSEALNHKEYKKVVYITISTGIGIGIIIDGKINSEFADSEVGNMMLEHDGKLQRWEDFASGRALKNRYGKLASEINDSSIWSEYVEGLVVGFEATLAAFQPEVVIIGGGVGAHFEKFGNLLIRRLKGLDNKMVPIPPIIKAKRPEEAVIYGCYDFIRQNLGYKS
ncbi:ROK family protein [Candidatus Saccharibacteria bacterium]|nr:ROK family protein [Candidatus Saccharibacteria bacterium]